MEGEFEMPIYEYECQNCGHIFEEITNRHRSFDTLECRKCNGYSKRVISLSNFRLKGRGWGRDCYTAMPKTKAPERVLRGDG